MPDLDDLPGELALEIDAACDDFERRWQRCRRLGLAPPDASEFLGRVPEALRSTLADWLAALKRDLCAGVALPVLPGFAIEDELGRGGMGVVYRARVLPEGRVVAVKVLARPEVASGGEHLLGLVHPNLVPVERLGLYTGIQYLVMALVPGGDLKERRGEFATPEAAADLLALVADALGYLHGRGLLHRDLKPSNILLAGQVPLVCDFDLVGRLDEAANVGTPAYMAPEQRAGLPLRPAADLWSLGAILRELVAEPPPGLAAVRDRCLREEPAARYATADEVARALRAFRERGP